MTGVTGYAKYQSNTSRLNALRFVMLQVLGGVRTAQLVKVISCTNSGGVSAVGQVVVQPLVNAVDGEGNAVPHGPLYALPYFRLQGGANAVIIDPQANDIGLAVFADRYISNVKSTKKQANPGSARQHSMADGLYIGGFLNGTPTQYIQFTDSGINLVDKNGNEISMQSGKILMTTALLDVTGDIHSAGVAVGSTHKHSGVTTGGGDTGNPI